MTGPLRIAANSKWSPSRRVQRRHVTYPVDARSNRGSGVGLIVTSFYPSSSNQRHPVRESTLYEMCENHRLMGAVAHQPRGHGFKSEVRLNLFTSIESISICDRNILVRGFGIAAIYTLSSDKQSAFPPMIRLGIEIGLIARDGIFRQSPEAKRVAIVSKWLLL
ncbi:unnamed protein product [Haemonchus placei]|uniref:Cyclin N-terminal domain-containing protein n=1 Tax=Haemonchus placei TaxID=6290 RepID=A0A0N4X4S9_HAEPC|nr:unnamed protein product [Haemonchus placei]